jgi:hypothetical protein
MMLLYYGSQRFSAYAEVVLIALMCTVWGLLLNG